MPSFDGFTGGKHRFVSVPGQFFSELLPLIDDLNEMRVTLAAFWRLDQMEGSFRYLLKADFLGDADLIELLGSPETLEGALDKMAERGTFLKACVTVDGKQVDLYFLNTPRGRAAVEAIRKGSWRQTGQIRQPLELVPERPNIYRLYEENIGPLTPMIADMLRDAEETYPEAWIRDALEIALANNVRRWRYVEAILRSWKEEGRDERKDRQDSKEDFRRYTQGRFAEFISS
jgi:DnaD/phage-associated family protein